MTSSINTEYAHLYQPDIQISAITNRSITKNNTENLSREEPEKDCIITTKYNWQVLKKKKKSTFVSRDISKDDDDIQSTKTDDVSTNKTKKQPKEPKEPHSPPIYINGVTNYKEMMSVLWTYENPYACVKCGGDHNTIICMKTANTPAKCVLCEESHPAKYKGCEVYKNLQQARGKPTNTPRYNTRQSKININDTNQYQSTSKLNALSPTKFIFSNSYTKPTTH
ncbi:unnamed protein product [Psylliodes chrysocephalus]|uniref:Uncharacterized protein n=1 Tax=Psylliodes chrysocephalus TaxID=3402493 RepID=A0A9P0CMP3_9CUCU|nr:unnamed protein product [Psylliodes chrysocephala]